MSIIFLFPFYLSLSLFTRVLLHSFFIFWFQMCYPRAVTRVFIFFLIFSSLSLTPLIFRCKTYKWSTIRSTVLTSNVLLSCAYTFTRSFYFFLFFFLFVTVIHVYTHTYSHTRTFSSLFSFLSLYFSCLPNFSIPLVYSSLLSLSSTSYVTMKTYSIDIALSLKVSSQSFCLLFSYCFLALCLKR